MKKPDIPINESERLKALSEYRILGTKPEENYDDITKTASLTCGTPIALLSLVDSDRQWFKAKVGIEAEETVRDWSFWRTKGAGGRKSDRRHCRIQE